METNVETSSKPLISVCVCTYRRPSQLEKLLQCLDRQNTGGLFDFSIVVMDNDARQSARSVVECWAERLRIPIVYAVEPRQNIALARNASVAMATGELLAFVDDDEEPSTDWLRALYNVLVEYRRDGVLGPVVPTFEKDAPLWAVKGGVFQRPAFETGEVMDSRSVGIGNALIKREVLLELEGPFRPQFGGGGEDQDFFRRAMARGRVFVWCSQALCYEPVPPERTKIGVQLRRALLRGKIALRGSGAGWQGILKSAIAVPVYALALPVCLTMGSHVFVPQLLKSFDHLGKLLAACGIDVVGDKYIS
jgi:cellulose synthase/poly-beta-1,6-N-acetylglucosamine synthase-like glycosyltransferase